MNYELDIIVGSSHACVWNRIFGKLIRNHAVFEQNFESDCDFSFSEYKLLHSISRYGSFVL